MVKFLLILSMNINSIVGRNNKDTHVWTHHFFDRSIAIKLPVVNFKKNTIDKNNLIELPHNIFNCTIRRDIIHRVYQYNKMYAARQNRWTKNKGMVAGAGRKPFKQKGNGRARQGNLRAPNLRKGGHVFALVPRNLYFQKKKWLTLQ